MQVSVNVQSKRARVSPDVDSSLEDFDVRGIDTIVALRDVVLRADVSEAPDDRCEPRHGVVAVRDAIIPSGLLRDVVRPLVVAHSRAAVGVERRLDALRTHVRDRQ